MVANYARRVIGMAAGRKGNAVSETPLVLAPKNAPAPQRNGYLILAGFPGSRFWDTGYLHSPDASIESTLGAPPSARLCFCA